MTVWTWVALLGGLALVVTAALVLFRDQRRHQRPVLVVAFVSGTVGLFAVASVLDTLL